MLTKTLAGFYENYSFKNSLIDITEIQNLLMGHNLRLETGSIAFSAGRISSESA